MLRSGSPEPCLEVSGPGVPTLFILRDTRLPARPQDEVSNQAGSLRHRANQRFGIKHPAPMMPA